MREIEKLEKLLAKACGALSEAASDVSMLPEDSRGRVKRSIADALVRAWDARDVIHAIRPELKPEYAVQAENDPEAHQAYCTAVAAALQLASSGSQARASAVMREFASTTSSAYFANLAEEKASRCGGAI
jgi:hypothetical protein